MLKSITIENFFSFGKTQTIELNPDVNILVGINASGKSNFFKALELLKTHNDNPIEVQNLIASKWGGIFNLLHKSKRSQDASVTFKSKKGRLSIPIKCEGLGFNFHFSYEPNYGELDFAKIKQNIGTSKPYEVNIYKNFNTSYNSQIRYASSYYSEEYLLEDGVNLTHLLGKLNTNHASSFEKLEGYLREVNSKFNGLAFNPYGNRLLLSLKEKNLEEAISIEHISDGTLSFLLLLSILYNPHRGNVVCLDEPEMGLHPDMIRMVAEGIKYAAANGTQMIVSTHSPLLLNSFELEDLLIFEKDEENNTIVKRKTEDDFKDWEGEFLVGQMWLRGQLGGVRW
jgi:predicted ATPase